MTDWKERAERAEAELARLRAVEPVAWVDVKDRHEGPYEFHGMALLDSGKHHLYAAPPAQPAMSDPVTLSDVLDALNVFNKPRPSEGDEPWIEADFISVKHLPDFINTIAAAWFSCAQPAEPVQRLSDEQAVAILRSVADPDKDDVLVPQGDMVVCTPAELARAIESALQPGWRDIETPPGWKLVPICLTPEMREVLLMADRFTVGEVYIMLLAAAPKATK